MLIVKHGEHSVERDLIDEIADAMDKIIDMAVFANIEQRATVIARYRGRRFTVTVTPVGKDEDDE